MALDIAALQFMYGANTSHRTGPDTYELPGANGVGAFYSCIWDAGGVDKIVGSDQGSTIDLRAATLLDAVGGGGFISFARGIHGGFTIANGVVIENALGGEAADRITGNQAGNGLKGLAGNDLIDAGPGDDRVLGGTGSDKLKGEAGEDAILGGKGGDTLTGGAQGDTLVGGEGVDRFDFNSTRDSPNGEDRDWIVDFEHRADKIDLRDIDAIAGGADSPFDFIGRSGFTAAGQARAVQSGADALVLLNTSGAAGAEAEIVLPNFAATKLMDGDFLP
jgi:serralysin